MEAKEKLELLKSLDFLGKIPEHNLARLSDFIDPVEVLDNQMIFDEGDEGDSLFFISKGQIRIEKLAERERGIYKTLAIMNAGDCFGEMTLIEASPRSARAVANGGCLLFKLDRRRLIGCLHSQPILTITFFTQLILVLSKRLRKTSNEVTLLSDLSSLLLTPFSDGKQLLETVLKHIVPHMEGQWSAVAFLYNEYNMEMDRVAVEGDFDESRIKEFLTNPVGHGNFWVNANTYYVSLPGKTRSMGHLLFHTEAKPNEEEKSEIGRLLTTTAVLIISTMENIQFKVEERMRDRLKARVSSVSI